MRPIPDTYRFNLWRKSALFRNVKYPHRLVHTIMLDCSVSRWQLLFVLTRWLFFKRLSPSGTILVDYMLHALSMQKHFRSAPKQMLSTEVTGWIKPVHAEISLDASLSQKHINTSRQCRKEFLCWVNIGISPRNTPNLTVIYRQPD